MFDLGFIVAVSLLVAPAPVAALKVGSYARTGWEGAGVFVFNNYVLDLTKMTEKNAPGSFNVVSDCSDDEYYCLRSNDKKWGVANFVVPKRCVPIAVGQRWEHNDVVTEVLASIREKALPAPSASPATYYLLGDPNRPNVIYEYSPTSGIRGIFRGRNQDNLFSSVKANGDLPSLRMTNRDWRIITFDDLASCRD